MAIFCDIYKGVKAAEKFQWLTGKAVEHRGLLLIVGTDSDKVIGVLAARKTERVQVFFLFVRPECRRKGVATRLWRCMIGVLGTQVKVTAEAFVSKETKGLDMFFRQIGMKHVELNRSRIQVKKNEWVQHVVPVLSLYAAKAQGFHCKTMECLNNDEMNRLRAIMTRLDEKDRFAVVNNGFTQGWTFVFLGNTGEIMGWMQARRITGGTVDLMSTYILPQFRDGRLVFAFYLYVTDYIIRQQYDVGRLIFYFDTFDKKLANYYFRLLARCKYIHECKYKYTLP